MYFKSLLRVICLCLAFLLKKKKNPKTSVTDTEMGDFTLTPWQQASHDVCAPSSRPRVQSLQPSVASFVHKFLGNWDCVYTTLNVLQIECWWVFRCNWGVTKQITLDHRTTKNQLLWTTAHFVVAAPKATAQEEWLQINRIIDAEKLEENRAEKHLRLQKSLMIHTWKFPFNVFVY